MKIRLSHVLNLLCFCFYILYTVFVYSSKWQFVLGAFAIFILANVLHSCIHELGHLVGGMLSSHRLLSISVLPFKAYAVRKNGLRTLRFKFSARFQCVMIPKKEKFLLYNLGGILANLIGILTAVLLAVIFSDLNGVFLAVIVCGVMKLFANGIPAFSEAGVPNDAQIVKIVLSDSIEKHNYFRYIRTYEKYFLGEKIDLPPKSDADHGFFYDNTVCLLEELEGGE